jgi:hypothetical protein
MQAYTEENIFIVVQNILTARFEQLSLCSNLHIYMTVDRVLCPHVGELAYFIQG